MDEPTALSMLEAVVDHAGDDAAVVDGHVLTIDMLHDETDFPDGVTRYTAGWRSVGASLSDVAAMGANPIAAVAAYGAPRFDAGELEAFVRGAQEVCELVGAQYVGGDLDTHHEFTVATAVLGEANAPVLRSGARPGDAVYVTGRLGRTVAAIDAFDAGDTDRGNDRFRFLPRVAVGIELAPHATAMMDSSDGLARSLHQLAAASSCGFDIERDEIPVVDDLDPADPRLLFFGEDFELVLTAPPGTINTNGYATPVTRIGRVTERGVSIDGEPLEDRGFQHG